MTDPTSRTAPPSDNDALEAAVEEAVASCDGDARAAVRALLLALEVYEAEVAALQDDVARIRAAVSPGYVRGRLGKSGRDEAGTT